MGTLQTDMQPRFRETLVDWMVGVCIEFAHLDESLFLAVEIMDLFFSKLRVDTD